MSNSVDRHDSLEVGLNTFLYLSPGICNVGKIIERWLDWYRNINALPAVLLCPRPRVQDIRVDSTSGHKDATNLCNAARGETAQPSMMQ